MQLNNKNCLLIISSTFFYIPVLIIILFKTSKILFYKYDIIILLLTTSISILRWSLPYYICKKMDKVMATFSFLYFFLKGFKIYSIKINIMYAIICYLLFFFSVYSRKKNNFKYWYIFHVLFHFCCSIIIIKYYIMDFV